MAGIYEMTDYLNEMYDAFMTVRSMLAKRKEWGAYYVLGGIMSEIDDTINALDFIESGVME